MVWKKLESNELLHFVYQPIYLWPAGLPVKELTLIIEQHRSGDHANAVPAGGLAPHTH